MRSTTSFAFLTISSNLLLLCAAIKHCVKELINIRVVRSECLAARLVNSLWIAVKSKILLKELIALQIIWDSVNHVASVSEATARKSLILQEILSEGALNLCKHVVAVRAPRLLQKQQKMD